MPDSDTARQPLLELGDLRTEDELPVVEDPLDASVDRFDELAILALEVDEIHSHPLPARPVVTGPRSGSLALIGRF